jgi:hypothetical protein
MSAEDCTATADYRAPLCSPAGTGGSVTSLASWISFDATGLFTIAPKSNRTVGYTINTPANAVPGGHYGAIFFNSPESTNGGTISMNRRIGSLLLITVPGTIIVAPEFGSILIDMHGGASPGVPTVGRDFWKFSQSGSIIDQMRAKSSKLMMVFTDPIIYQPILDTINPFWNTPSLESAPIRAIDSSTEDIENKNISEPIVSLWLPVDNRGTIHIIPEGKITLYTADGTQLMRVGKEVIKNENGAIIWEKIVDYLTINEEDGNVLPSTSRTFTMNWYGFARENIGTDGKAYISYETPSQHYSRIAREESGYIYPWEKLARIHIARMLTARVDISYMDPVTRTIVSRNYDLPIRMESDEVVKTYNTGLLTPIVIIGSIWLWTVVWRRRRYHYNSHNILIAENGDDEIAVLERARAVMFAKEATRAAISSQKNIIPKISKTKKIVTKDSIVQKTTVASNPGKPTNKKTVAKKISATVQKGKEIV